MYHDSRWNLYPGTRTGFSWGLISWKPKIHWDVWEIPDVEFCSDWSTTGQPVSWFLPAKRERVRLSCHLWIWAQWWSKISDSWCFFKNYFRNSWVRDAERQRWCLCEASPKNPNGLQRFHNWYLLHHERRKGWWTKNMGSTLFGVICNFQFAKYISHWSYFNGMVSKNIDKIFHVQHSKRRSLQSLPQQTYTLHISFERKACSILHQWRTSSEF